MGASKGVRMGAVAIVIAIAIIAAVFFLKSPVSKEQITPAIQEEVIPAKAPTVQQVKPQEIVRTVSENQITFESGKTSVADIKFSALSTNISNVSSKLVKPANPAFKSQILAVKDAKFSEAEITLSKSGNVDAIFYCGNFDFENESCYRNWEKTEIPFTQTANSVSFKVTHFSAYVAGTNTSLRIYSYSRPAAVQITFYANYLNTSYSLPINNSFANLTINFSDAVSANMTFNPSSQLWEYNRSFSSDGTYSYTVQTYSSYENLNATDNITIYNCTVPYDDFYINENTTLCPGDYVLSDSFNQGILIINSSDVTLDCNGANLSDETGYFLYSSGFSNINVKNCAFHYTGLTYFGNMVFRNSENLTITNITYASMISISNISNILIRGVTINIPNIVHQCVYVTNFTNLTIADSWARGNIFYNMYTPPVLEISSGSNLSIYNTTFETISLGLKGFSLSNVSNILINRTRSTGSYSDITFSMKDVSNVTITNSDLRSIYYVSSTVPYDFSNVSNSSFKNSLFSAMNLNGINVQIVNNTFNVSSVFGQNSFTLSNSTIENNTFYTRQQPLTLHANNVSFSNNVFDGSNVGSSPSGLLDLSAFNSLIKNSVFFNCYYVYGACIALQVWSTNNTVFDNITIDHSPYGLQVGSGNNNTFTGLNIHDISNYAVFASSPMTIENSTIFNNGHDIAADAHFLTVTIKNSVLGPYLSSRGYSGFNVNATNVSLFGNKSYVTYDSFNITKTTDNYILFSNNSIYINSSALPELNKTAIITFTDLPWSTTPMLFKDGVRCDNDSLVCNNTVYDALSGVLTSQVFSFSNYTTGNASTCFNVTDNFYVNRNTILCSGSFNVADAGNDGIIILNKSGVNLTFSNTFIFGAGSGKGIVAQNLSDISISCTSDCGVRNFSEGVYFNNVSNINTPFGILQSALNSKGYAIYNSTNINLSQADIQWNNVGLFVEGGANNTFSSSFINNNYSIYMQSSKGAFFNGYYASNKGFYVYNSSDFIFNFNPPNSYYDPNAHFIINSTNFTILYTGTSVVQINISLINSTLCNLNLYLSESEIRTFGSTNINVSGTFVNSSVSITDSSNVSVGGNYDYWFNTENALSVVNSSGVFAGNVHCQNVKTCISVNNSEIEIANISFLNSNISIYGDGILSGSAIKNISITNATQYGIFSRNSSFSLEDVSFSTPVFIGNGVNVSASNVSFASQNATMRFDSVQINDTVNTSGIYLLYNLSGIDLSVSPGLNKSARITLNYLPWTINPLIEKDSIRCDNTSECTVVSYNTTTGTLIFDVLGFSNYSSSSPYVPGTPDITPPTLPTVYDGLNFIDYNWTNNVTALKASWNNSFDRSNIFYSYRIMDSNGSCYNNECTLKFVGSAQQITVSNLSLSPCHKYIFEVQAEDTFYNVVNVTSSDGITLDTPVPYMISVSSPTHPNPGIAYPSSTVRFQWTATDYPICPSGIAGYSYLLDQDAYSYPDSIIDTNATNITLTNVPNGIWQFHIAPIDYAGNVGGVFITQVIVNSTQVSIKLNPSETPTLSSNATITGQIALNVSDTLLIYNNNVYVKNITISPTQTLFNFTINLDLGINAIFANASLNSSSVGKSNTLYIRRGNETRVNATGFTVSYAGGSLTDTSASNLLYSSTTNAMFGIGKSEDRIFLFVTKPDADAAMRIKYVTNNTLFDQINPSIGYPFQIEQNVISTILNYQDIVLSGNDSVQSGRYSLVITNNGTVNGKTQVLVRIV